MCMFFIPNAVTGKSHAHSLYGFRGRSLKGFVAALHQVLKNFSNIGGDTKLIEKMCKTFAYHCMKAKDGYSLG